MILKALSMINGIVFKFRMPAAHKTLVKTIYTVF